MKRLITAALLALSLTLSAACQGSELPVEFTPTCYQTPVGEVCPKGGASTTTPETAP